MNHARWLAGPRSLALLLTAALLTLGLYFPGWQGGPTGVAAAELAGLAAPELGSAGAAQIAPPPRPSALALHPTLPRLYVATTIHIVVFDVSTGMPTNGVNVPLPVGAWGASGLAVHPAGTRLYVANADSADLSVYEIVDGALVNGVRVALPEGTAQPSIGLMDGTGPRRLVVNPAGTRLYVANRSGSITTYDVSAGAPTTPVNVQVPAGAERPLGIAIHPSGNYLYLGNVLTRNLTVFDISSGTPGNAVNVPLPVGAMEALPLFVHPNGSRLYVGTATTDDPPGVHRPAGYLSVYELSGGMPTNGVNVPVPGSTGSPISLAVDPAGTRMYTGETDHELVVYDITTGMPTNPMQVPIPAGAAAPLALLLNSAPTRLYVANVATDNLTVYEIVSGTPTNGVIVPLPQ